MIAAYSKSSKTNFLAKKTLNNPKNMNALSLIEKIACLPSQDKAQIE